MSRVVLACFVVTVCLVSSAPGAMFKFVPGTVPEGENALVVIGDGTFELSDTPLPAPNDFQFPAVQSFDVRVEASDGAGGSKFVDFALLRGSTTDGHVNLIFGNNDHTNLLVSFDVEGITKGASFPSSVSDADGIVNWNAPSLEPPSLSAGILAGSLEGSQIAVPEPVGLTGMLIGIVGLSHRLRRRK